MSEEDRAYFEQARREKLEALVAAGIPGFAYRFERSHTLQEAADAFADTEDIRVQLAGRVTSHVVTPGESDVSPDTEEQARRLQTKLRGLADPADGATG